MQMPFLKNSHGSNLLIAIMLSGLLSGCVKNDPFPQIAAEAVRQPEVPFEARQPQGARQIDDHEVGLGEVEDGIVVAWRDRSARGRRRPGLRCRWSGRYEIENHAEGKEQ